MMIGTIILAVIGIAFLGLSFGYVEIDDLTGHADSEKPKRLWHWFKGFFQGFFYAAMGFDTYGLSWELVLFVIMILALTAMIFNPIINHVRKRGNFFYIGKAGYEGWFYKIPIFYYFLNVAIVVGTYITLNHILR